MAAINTTANESVTVALRQKSDADALGREVPFRSEGATVEEQPATLRGELPEWLKGQLVRTAPAVFEVGKWRAEHWFDGLGMLYAFRISDQRVSYSQRMLDSSVAQTVRGGGSYEPGGFGSPMKRSWFRRIFEPVPEITDNANVNVVPMGDELVAMTESPRQLAIDPRTLQTKGEVAYRDRLDVIPSAHPQFDFARKEVINVASRIGAKSALVVYAHDPIERKRRVVAEWRTGRLPYVHSFGLSRRHAVLIGHPLDVNPLSLLWSNRPFIDHFAWRPTVGTRLIVADRETGTTREFETDPMFVFHTIHAFDEGTDVVVDVAAYDDPTIIQALCRGSLGRSMPSVAPRAVRLRMRAGERRATRETLSDRGFEFPSVDYRRTSGRGYQFVWGTALEGRAQWRSTLVQLDTIAGTTRELTEPDWIFGEPVFVAEPTVDREGQGVLLVVGTHFRGERSAMLVVDAESMQVRAWAEIQHEIPIGFHGSFVRS